MEAKSLENHVHRVGIARHFLLIAAGKRFGMQPGEQLLHLRIAELGALDTGGRPTLSIVAIRRRVVSFSGARVSMTFQRPLNSSISAMSLRISGVIVMFLMLCMG
jgi:hypothetical protein